MKILLTLLLSCIATTHLVAIGNSYPERDSILARINAIENDSARLAFEVVQQYKYIRSPFARDLVDKLYEDARKMGDKEKEMLALCGYFNIAFTTFDIENIEKALKNIESHAIEYNLYDYFYRCKRSYLSAMASNGNMEWVLNEAKKMKKEAQSLNHKTGVISAQISIAQAYKFARNDSMVIVTMQEILNIPEVEDKEKTSIYQDLYTSFQNLKRYKEGMKYLDLQNELLDRMIKKDPNAKSYIESRRMHNQTLYADAYMALGNYSKAEQHLKKADKYYTPYAFIPYYVLYHSTYATYYAHLKKWNLCADRMDSAINRLGQEQPLLKHSMLARKSKYLEQAGELKETVRMHRELLYVSDSLNKAFLQKQEEALAENYRLELGLEKKAKYAYVLSLISTIFFILLLLMSIGFVIQLYMTHIRLKKNKKEAEEAKSEAIKSDRLRKALLNNISKEIETPINQIKKLSEEISVDVPVLNNSLVSTVESEAGNLIRLLDLVVEFSQLEVDAIKFNIRETDILSACFDAIDIAKKHPENKTEIYFTSQIEIQPVPFDRDWMLYCLSSAMIDIADSIIPNKLNFNIKYSNDGQSVVLTMVGSPLANPLFLGQIQTLKNHINHLTIKNFKGSYEVQISELRPILTISLPLRMD